MESRDGMRRGGWGVVRGIDRECGDLVHDLVGHKTWQAPSSVTSLLIRLF